MICRSLVLAAFSFCLLQDDPMVPEPGMHLWAAAPSLPAPSLSGAPIESLLNNPSVQKTKLAPGYYRASGAWNAYREQFVVHIRKGKLHGAWTSYFHNGNRCDSGALVRNLPDGEWKTWYPNGQLKTVRTYRADLYHLVQSDLRRAHPKAQQFAITRQALKGQDVSRYFQPAYGPKAQDGEHYSIFQKIGHNTQDRQAHYLPPFHQSLHHGLYLNYTEQGVLSDSGRYVSGLRHGHWKETHAATVAEGWYEQGHRKGQWKYFTAEGRLLYTEIYNASGKLTGRHRFRE
ncbi:MAG TPA: hypothetical protein VHK69_02055 [Chitinophagaceae bacterium]|nr:hypothetical protein [Chitinophagaceae bacterium]